MTISLKDIARLRELEGKATQGRWKVIGDAVFQEGGTHIFPSSWSVRTEKFDDFGKPVYEAFDANFIAESRNLLPALLDTIEAMNEALKYIADKNTDVFHPEHQEAVEWASHLKDLATSAMLRE